MKIARLLSFISVLLVGLLSSSPAWSQYKLIKSNIAIIDNMTKEYRGKTLNQAELDTIIQSIAQDGLYQVVLLESVGNNQVVIRAEQSSKVNQIQFDGNVSFERGELLDAMKVKPGAILSELEVIQAVNRVEEKYTTSGFYNFRIKYDKVKLDDGIKLVIKIDERSYCVIEDIQIFAKNDYLLEQVNELIQKYLGENYKQETSKKIEKDLEELLLSHRFLTAKVQNTATVFNDNKTKVKLKFTVDNATQFEFIFHGNEYFSHFDLLKQSEVGSKFLYISDSSSEIVESVTDIYLQNGFPEVKVTNTEQYFAGENKKVYVFRIDEGPRVRIGKVNVFGKISREKSFYIDLFNDHLAEEAHSVFFVQKDIENAADKMVISLKRSGHLQAELLSLNFDFTNNSSATINIQIDEGILTYVRQILFRGSKSFANPVLREEVTLEPNKPLDIGDVEASFDKLENFYKNKGYLEFKIKNRNANVIQYNPGQPYADIVYEVTEGPQIVVRDIKVNGTQKTEQYVVVRELDFRRGDILTLNKVSLSIERLEKTGLFGKVNIRTLEEGTSQSQRTIVVEVEERKPGLFSSGIGLANEGLPTLRGYVGTLYNNLWGKARAISGRLDLRYRDRVFYPENRLALSYHEPYLSRDRLRGRVTLVREQEFSQFQEGDARIRSSNEIRISTEKELSETLRLTYNVWSFSNQEFFRVGGADDQSNTINIGSTGPILEIDYRNDEFLPTSGTYTRMEFEYSDPILGSSRDNPAVSGFSSNFGPTDNQAYADKNSEINYYKTYFATTRYTPLTKNHRWVWANSVRGGYLKNISSRSDSGVPRVRSFFLGGSSTIRGFSLGTTETVPGKRELCIAQGLSAIDQATDESLCQLDDIYVRDDSVFFLVKSELRFPISGAFGGLIFYDGGAVYLGGVDLNDPYRDSIGFGFRYDTPVGSFVVEMGYKLDRKTGGPGTVYEKESDVAIHLSIGTF